MPAQILDGRALARQLRDELRGRCAELAGLRGRAPALAVVQVAGDDASDRYVRSIRRQCEEIGASFQAQLLPGDTTQAALEQALAQLSGDPGVDGVMLQLPLPGHLAADRAVLAIDPSKDVDGVTPQSAGLLLLGQRGFVPSTPAGGMELLRRYAIALRGRRAVVVGRSAIVGKPMALLLLQEHATVTIAHSRTEDLAGVVREAEIVVAAVGRPGLIRADMVCPGATVIDFGINVLEGGALVGDVDTAGVSEVAGAITPVPGGTGPMTNVMLMRNLLDAAAGRGPAGG